MLCSLLSDWNRVRLVGSQVAIIITLLVLSFVITTKQSAASDISFINRNELTSAGNDPRIAVDGNSLHVVWSDNGKIIFKKSEDNGKTFGDQVEIARAKMPFEYEVVNSGNRVYVAWIDSDYDDYKARGVYISRSSNGGVSFDSPVNLSTNRLDSPGVVFVGLGLATTEDKVYVVWQMANSYGWQPIYFSKSEDFGDSYSAPKDIWNNPSGNPQIYAQMPVMSVSGDNVFVVWEEYDESDYVTAGIVSFVKSSDSGNNFGPIKTLSENGTTPLPEVLSDGNNLYLTWYDENGMSFVRSRDFGNSFEDTLIFTSDFGYPKISKSGNGGKEIYITYLSQPLWDVQFLRSNDAGVSFTESRTLTNNTISPSVYDSFVPSILSFANQVYIMFPHKTPDGTHMSLLASIDTGKNFTDTQDLEHSLGVSSVYKGAVSKSGLHLVWNNGSSIWYAQYPNPKADEIIETQAGSEVGYEGNLIVLPTVLAVSAIGAIVLIGIYLVSKRKKTK
jgi:hypothetical protein